LKTSHYAYNSLSKDSTSFSEEYIARSQDSRLDPLRDQRSLSRCLISPSTDSRSSYDSHEFLTEEDSNLDVSQLSQNTEDSFEKNKDSKCLLSKRKQYSMKDGAVRSRALYERRRKNESTEIERLKEIKELRKTFEKNNEIQEKRNKLLEDFIEELKTSKNKV